jgi:hypothetical protein
MQVTVQLHAPATLYHMESPAPQKIGGQLGLRAGVDVVKCRKFFDTAERSIVQPVDW